MKSVRRMLALTLTICMLAAMAAAGGPALAESSGKWLRLAESFA